MAFIVDGACVEQGCSEVMLHWEGLCGPGEWKEIGQIHVLFVVWACDRTEWTGWSVETWNETKTYGQILCVEDGVCGVFHYLRGCPSSPEAGGY